MSLAEAFQDVRNCAREFQFQHSYTKRENRTNVCLAVSRMFLEIACANYRVINRRTTYGV